MYRKVALALTALVALWTPAIAHADVVTSWNRTMVDATEAAKTPPPVSARVAAIVQSSVFDAVNGIARRYEPVHVEPVGPHGASRAAAAASAAHEALVVLFPAQQAQLDQQLADTLAGLPGGDGDRAIARGVVWGKTVADEILTWRAGDGFSADPGPYTPAGLPGRWQPTPPMFGPLPLFRQFATMTPFAIASPGQFVLPGPPPLDSSRYAEDFNQVKELGSGASPLRTQDETDTAKFWQLDTPAAMWNRVADDLGEAHDVSLLGNARRLALMNMALADATIAIWDAKKVFDSWRPVTAIRLADTDGNPDTAEDPAWTPLLPTPQFQEYPSAHSGVSNAAASVLARFYGDDTSFTVTSVGFPAVQRSFTSFAAAVGQVEEARVFAGFHFAFACIDGANLGAAVADYVNHTALLRVHGHGDDDAAEARP